MTFSRYFVYRLKHSILRTAIWSFIAFVLTAFVVSSERYYATADKYKYNDISLFTVTVFLALFATLIPIVETTCFKKRRNLDTLFSLPISQTNLALAHYVSGLVQLTTVFSVSFFTLYFYTLWNTECFALKWMFVYYLVALLLGCVVYSVILFLYSEANTVFDGIFISFFWISAGLKLLWLVKLILRSIGILKSVPTISYEVFGILYQPLTSVTTVFENLIEIHKTHTPLSSKDQNTIIIGCVIWVLIGLAASFGYLFNMTRKGAEKTGEITTSWFGYRILIPLSGITFLLSLDPETMYLIFVLISMLIGYIIHRRGVKLKLSDGIVLTLTTLCGIVRIWQN